MPLVRDMWVLPVDTDLDSVPGANIARSSLLRAGGADDVTSVVEQPVATETRAIRRNFEQSFDDLIDSTFDS